VNALRSLLVDIEAGKVPRARGTVRQRPIGPESGASVKNAATGAGREAQYPGYGRRLVERLSKGPKALDDVDRSALLDRIIQAENVEINTAVVGYSKIPETAVPKFIAQFNQRVSKS